MQSSRRSFLRGVASIAGAASAQTAYAQHVHPAPPGPQQTSRPTPPSAPVPPHELGPGIAPVVSPDVPDMPWRLENGVKVFDSGTVRGGQAARSISVSVAGAQQLRLVVTSAGDGDAYDHADWANARLFA